MAYEIHEMVISIYFNAEIPPCFSYSLPLLKVSLRGEKGAAYMSPALIFKGNDSLDTALPTLKDGQIPEPVVRLS